MALTRKRKKELKRLRGEADTLLQDQREVLEHASKVVREAGRQAGTFAREDVAPRIKNTYDDRVRPVVDSGLSVTRSAAHTAREKITDDVFPAVGTALASAIAVIDAAKHPDVRKALSDASKSASKTAGKLGDKASKTAGKASDKAVKLGTKAGVKAHVIQPKSSGPGKYILIGLAVVAVAGVAYAAWQTLRADDDLWIDDEVDESDVETPQA